jgi:chalcone isomerase
MALTKGSSLTPIHVESLQFPASITSPATAKTYFLGGAGERGLTIEGKFIKFTGIGVYLEDTAVDSLSPKWKGKTPEELNDSLDFFRDIISSPTEKLIRGSKLRPLSGVEYSSKVMQNCVAHMKSAGIYGGAEAAAIEKFTEAFRNVHFPPGSSVFYRQSPDGKLGLSFSQDDTIPEKEAVVIENKALSEAVLETMIGEHAVSPDLKHCLAERLPVVLNQGLLLSGN